MLHPGVEAGVWGAVAAATLGCLLEPASSSLLVGYDPVPSRMEPRPFLDAWAVLAAALEAGKAPFQAMSALEHELAYGGLTAEDEIGVAVFWGLAYHGCPALASARAGRRTGLVAALVAAPPEAMEQAVEADGAGPAHLAAKVALKLREAGPEGSLLERTVATIAAARGLPFGQALAFALQRGMREPEALAAVGARAALCEGLPSDWAGPLGEAFVAGWGLRSEPPATLAGLAASVAQLAHASSASL